jgi:type I restriction enzyme S subunit
MEVKSGYKQTDVGIIPEEWNEARIEDVATIHVGRDLREEHFSRFSDSTYKFPVYSNTVAEYGLYGFYSVPEYEGDSVTVVGRGVGLGTAFARTGGYGAIGRLLVLFPNGSADARFLATYINQRVSIFIETGGIPQLTGIQFAKYKVAIPPMPEQRAIAGALSDVDALLGALDQIIAKKRDLKQAAMQQLLTGQTRLPGFHGEWEVRRLGEILIRLKKTNRPSAAGKTEGGYPFFTNSTKPCDKFLDEADFDTEAIIANTGGEAYFNYYKGAFAAMSDCFVFETKVVTRFLYYFLKSVERVVNDNGFTGSGIKHLDKRFFSRIELRIPVDQAEQTSIAEVLTDMDAELAALEQRRDKTRALKQGMMQELLTGKTRLI